MPAWAWALLFYVACIAGFLALMWRGRKSDEQVAREVEADYREMHGLPPLAPEEWEAA
ncbi:MAG TPA: hypothetical protein VF202_02235 [Trueperaceae bacterium]